MHLHVNFITLAENEGDAKSNVRCFIDDYASREFFDYGGLVEPEEVVLLNEIRERLAEDKAEVDNLLPVIEHDIQTYKEAGNRGWQGFCHKRYGEILSEGLTSDMPFFNIEDWDWSLPTEVPEKSKGREPEIKDNADEIKGCLSPKEANYD
jgi:hypothetical protein